MDEGNMQSCYERDADYLRAHAGFNELPSRFRDLVLKSSHASADFASFYANGGQIVGDANEPLASYRSEPQREIRINHTQLEFAKTEAGAHLVDGMFSTVAHEIGHDKDRGANFQRGTADEYVQFRSEKEAKAIFNAFPIFADLTKNEPSFKPVWKDLGYSPMGLAWPPLYNQWRDGSLSESALIKEMAKSVADYPYTRRDGLTDQNADGLLTQRDLYLRDFQGVLQGPDSEPNRSQGAGRAAAGPDHLPAHPLLNGLDQKVAHALHNGPAMTDAERRNVVLSLAAASATAGIQSIDHVVVGDPLSSGDRNIFAIHGDPSSPGHSRAHVGLAEAARTPALESANTLAVQDKPAQEIQQSETQRAPISR